jgi:hypothetical protein
MNIPINIKRSAVVFAAALLLGGCEDLLSVDNPNQGGTDKVLATPADAENLLGSYFKRWHSGLNGDVAQYGMASVMSFENYSSLANNCMNNHTPFTGATNFNSPGNTCRGEQYRVFGFNSEVNKVAAIFLKKFELEGFTLGTPGQDIRAQAFANFLVGLSVGYNALVYDSLAMANAATGAQEAPPFIHYTAARDSMVIYMGKAITLANDPGASGPGGFPLPSNWVPSATSMSAANFIRLVRSYRARILAGMGRTPAERAAADWAMIDADAAAGFTADFNITTSTTEGPTHGGWRNTFAIVNTTAGLWHQMPPFYLGMADSSGAYAAWIAQPLGDRGAGNVGLLVQTTDLRFPQGATRAAQQADLSAAMCSAAVDADCQRRYFINRTASADQYTGAGWGFSNYDHFRHYQWDTYGVGTGATSRNGPTMDFGVAELNLLRAEAAYRAGSYGAAAGFVNISRAAAGLPAAPGDNTTQVPAGVSANSCVPKVPVAPNYNTIACGTLWDAIVYEKYVETVYTSYLGWFFDARGWGLLAETLPLMWATPFDEIQARGRPSSAIYGMGIGAGNLPGSAAGPSYYGWEVPR